MRCYLQFLSFPHDFTIVSAGFASQFCKPIGIRKISVLIQCNNIRRNLPNIQVEYKFQEEVLQDYFMLKMIQLFDSWWMQRGLDLKISTFKIVPTDDGIGFSQIFDNIETLKNIREKYGTGLASVDVACLNKYLDLHNKGAVKELASELFRRSLAGYCVANYVMGVVEREYNYYLISDYGRFLQRTFGKHLFGGSKKDKVLLPYSREMEAVIFRKGNEAEDKEYFFNLCYSAINILRKQSHELLNLLGMMVVANMPSLQDYDPLEYVKEALNLGGNDADTNQNVGLLLCISSN